MVPPRRPSLESRLAPTRPPRRTQGATPHLWTDVPMYFGAVAWTVTLVAFMFASRATPRHHGIDRFFGVTRSREYDGDLLRVALGLLFFTLVLCSAGIAVHTVQAREGAERTSRQLLVLAAISVVGIVVCWWRLG